MKSTTKSIPSIASRRYAEVRALVSRKLVDDEAILVAAAKKAREAHELAVRLALLNGLREDNALYNCAFLLSQGLRINETGPRTFMVEFTRIGTLAIWGAIQAGLVCATYEEGTDAVEGTVLVGQVSLEFKMESGEPVVRLARGMPEAADDILAMRNLRRHREKMHRVSTIMGEVK